MNKPSPYVGPRAYRIGEELYGRDKEALDLIRLILAERVVLLYSPSGAGKTSLLTAKLTPALEEEEFQILGPARVSGAPDQKTMGDSVNPYVASLISYWEEGCPDDVPPLTSLSGIDLPGYLAQRSWIRSDPRPVVLILDQFEEILTHNPRDWSARQEFFRQLGLALHNRERWAVISMREEHIAGLDPYLHQLPTRLSTRYRLELLSPERAREAIEGPAKSAGVPVNTQALDRLISELTAVREPGVGMYHTAYVEPLHLQVVCDQLWQKLPEDTMEVGPHLVDTGGTVGEALEFYYRGAIQAAVQSPLAVEIGRNERRIRDWFEYELISPSGLRLQLQKGANTTGSLPNGIVDALEARYLLRYELRRGTLWCELAHDRLIEAVKGDNRAWYETQAEALRLLKDLGDPWQDLRNAGRFSEAEAKLLTGELLTRVVEWAGVNAGCLSSRDESFLNACQEREEREREKVKRRNALAYALSVIMVMVLGALVFSSAMWHRERETNSKLFATTTELQATNKILDQTVKEFEATDEQRQAAERESRIRKLLSYAAQARWRMADHELAALLALQAERFLQETEETHDSAEGVEAGTGDASPTARREGQKELRTLLEDTLRGVVQLRPFTLSPQLDILGREWCNSGQLAFSPDGRFIAQYLEEREVEIFPLLEEGKAISGSRLRIESGFRTLGFSESGRYLVVSTDSDIEMFLAEGFASGGGVARSGRADIRIPTRSRPTGPFCLTAGDSILFAASEAGIERWSLDVSTGGATNEGLLTPAGGDMRTVTALACDPEARWTAMGDSMGRITILPSASDGGKSSVVENNFADWPQDMAERLRSLRWWLDYGVSALIPWPKKNKLIAVFRHGPIGLITLPEGPNVQARLVYLSPTKASEGELGGSAAQGRAVREFVRRPKLLRAALDRDENRLVVGGEVGLGEWNLTTVYSDPDGKYAVRLQEARPGQAAYFARYREMPVLRAPIQALNIIRGANIIAAADAQSNVRLLRMDGLKNVGYATCSIRLSEEGFAPGMMYSIRFLADNRTLVSAGSRSLAFLQVNPKDLDIQKVDELPCFQGSFRAASLGPGGNHLAIVVSKPLATFEGCRACPARDKAALWIDATQKTGLGSLGDPLALDVPRSSGMWSVAWGGGDWAKGREVLAVGDFNGKVWIWNFKGGKPQSTEVTPDTLPRSSQSVVRAVAFHPIYPLLALGAEDGALEIWKLGFDAAGKLEAALLNGSDWEKNGPVRALAWSPDGHALVYGNDHGLVGTIPTDSMNGEGSWTESRRTYAHTMGVTDLTFCKDAASSASNREDSNVLCDNHTFVSAGNDGKVKFWQIEETYGVPQVSLRPRLTLEGPDFEVLSVALSPDGKLVAAGDAMGRVHLWRIEPKGLVENICSALHRNLSWREWTQYVGSDEPYQKTCSNLPSGVGVPGAAAESAR